MSRIVNFFNLNYSLLDSIRRSMKLVGNNVNTFRCSTSSSGLINLFESVVCFKLLHTTLSNELISSNKLISPDDDVEHRNVLTLLTTSFIYLQIESVSMINVISLNFQLFG